MPTPHTPPRRAALRVLATLLCLVCGAATAAMAQAGSGTVEGSARSAQDGAPLPFLLVRMVPAERSSPPRSMVTDAEGRFRFADVPPGEYRVQVEQIGYQRTVSPALRVEPGGTVRQEVRSAMEPIRLAGITVGGRCVDAAQLAGEPRLATLWNEARKGVETRRAFALQYRFTRTLRQEIQMKPRIGKTHRESRADTSRSEPDSVRARALRRAEARQREGYATRTRTSFHLSLPDELELLDDSFLRDHCLHTGVEEEAGAFALRFRPLRAVRGRVDIQGAIWVDARTYLIRRLDVEYVDGRSPLGQVAVQYRDVPVDGRTLRLPTHGDITGHPGGVMGALFARVSADFTLVYDDFHLTGTR